MIKLRSLLRSKRGDVGIGFIGSAFLLLFVFTVLIAGLIYIMKYYSASYVCRRVVRDIEIAGEYDESAIRTLVDDLGGNIFDDLSITMAEATYLTGGDYTGRRCIQLQDSFRIKLTASYKIKIFQLNDHTSAVITLPIVVSLAGRSERYWK